MIFFGQSEIALSAPVSVVVAAGASHTNDELDDVDDPTNNHSGDLPMSGEESEAEDMDASDDDGKGDIEYGDSDDDEPEVQL